ncbi:MAG: alpha/beta hydrolase fold domain-containing protein [Verrucomicrobiae bacterium]|nr:alpha/beta hydrolase fold domain-containing protein [Verrucomicrobiae bacterium]
MSSEAGNGPSLGVFLGRVLAIGIAILLVAGLIISRRRGDSLIEWQTTLLATECGHWLAVGAILGAGFAFFLWPPTSWLRWGLGLTLIAAAAAFLEPLCRAAWQAPTGISLGRLWWPPSQPDTSSVEVERKVYWDSGNGRGSLEMVVCRPSSGEGKRERFPWVVSIHGGGWNGGRPDEFLKWDRELASHGYVVVMPAYRLAPEHQWPAQREDIRHAVEWVRDHADDLGIDPANLTLFGRSAGGQIATACAFGVPELRVARCVAFYSPHDLYFARKYARADDVLDSLKLLRDYLGGDPEEVEDAYRSSSGILQVNRSSPPTLLVHGTRDTLVWVEQSRRLEKRMQAVGAPVRYLELPWATHAFDYFPSSPGGQVAMREMLRFLSSEPR